MEVSLKPTTSKSTLSFFLWLFSLRQTLEEITKMVPVSVGDKFSFNTTNLHILVQLFPPSYTSNTNSLVQIEMVSYLDCHFSIGLLLRLPKKGTFVLRMFKSQWTWFRLLFRSRWFFSLLSGKYLKFSTSKSKLIHRFPSCTKIFLLIQFPQISLILSQKKIKSCF